MFVFCSSKFKSFSYIYNEEQFIAALANDVIVVKSLPKSLKEARKRKNISTFSPKNSASPTFYIRDVLPKLKQAKVIGLVINDGGCLQVRECLLRMIFTPGAFVHLLILEKVK